jgi:peptidoglycan-N-acetylglucosamine deacetylase
VSRADLAWNWPSAEPHGASRRRPPRGAIWPSAEPQGASRRRPPRRPSTPTATGRRRAVGLGALLIALAMAAAGLSVPERLSQVARALGIAAAPSAREIAERRWRQHLAREGHALDRVLSYTPFISAGVPNRPEIALTFDDGPGPHTAEIVRTLVRNRAPGTFFVVGSQVATFPTGLQQIIATGFPVGNHTFTHRSITSLSRTEQSTEIDGQAAAITRYGAPSPRLFRPPYGSFDGRTLELLRARRMLMVLWTVDTEDYLRPGVEAIVTRALQAARPGAIIALHDGGGDRRQTIAAIPKIVRALRARGYRLVTVPRLILDDPPPRNQPLPVNVGGGGTS